MCLGTVVKTSAKWFCGLVVVSTFLKFPIQMNFAENKKWPTSARWRGRTLDVVGGYVRGVGGSRQHLLRASALGQTVGEYHPLCTISCGLPPSGLQCYWVLWWAVKLQETGCYGVHGLTGYTL